MKAPVSWLREYVAVPPDVSPRRIADELIRVGMEVESVESGADGIAGPLVVGRVVSFDDEPQKNGKTIRWCSVDVGAAEPRGIVCGASNFASGDLVVVALPGAVLPGGFAIGARKTYGHVSDGMICSVRELGIGEDHTGILVLPAESAKPGDDALDALDLRDAVLDVAVTTDRGYCLSIRGLARETGAAFDVAFSDIAPPLPPVDGAAWPIAIDDPSGCDRFSARAITDLDPSTPSPDWLTRRLRQCGIRAISLPVDVTNYVMLETGQPLHAFDRAKVSGPISARRARGGETLTTLDGAVRRLDPADMVVADGSGPIGLAGVMGGASTEIGPATTDVLLEAAHWNPGSIARTARRHRLPTEASRRFERDVDPQIAGAALQRCVDLLVEYGGARALDGYTVVGSPALPAPVDLPAQRPGDLAGMPIGREEVVGTLEAVGCTIDGGQVLHVQPPSWRPDLLHPADLVEEVLRLVGYERIPSVLPQPRAGTGLTPDQALRRQVSRALADTGLVEVLSSPFSSATVLDDLDVPADDARRRALRLVNPLSDTDPYLRTSLLPGLLQVLTRNLGRGLRDVAIFETGVVFERGAAGAAPLPGVLTRPSAAEITALYGAVPPQPRHVAVVLTGSRERRGWWGAARPFTWADAIESARVVARAARVELATHDAAIAPWHPGRCAALLLGDAALGDVVIGHAGELHPGVIEKLGLPARTCAMELVLDAFAAPDPVVAPRIATYPPVLLDLALVVRRDVPAADVLAAVRDGAGDLLESARLFDVYADEQRLGGDVKSLAFELVFRAGDRTLTVEQATAARDAAVVAAAGAVGASLRV